MKSLKIFTPATVSNVSCAFDILGFALDNVGDEMSFTKTIEKGVQIKIIGNNKLPNNPLKNVAGVVAIEMLKIANANFGIRIEIDKKIKPGSGIGSSGASSAGAAFGVNRLLNNKFNKTELVEFAMLGESLASGDAHADNVAPAIFGGFTLVRSYSPLDVIKLHSPSELYCTVIHPQIEIKTEDARKILTKNILFKDAIVQWGNVAGLIAGLYSENYELIGRSLHDEIVEHQRSSLIPMFYNVKQAILEAGALGGGISGSGPSVFALSKGNEVAENVAQAMKNVYEKTNIDFEIHVSKINSVGIKEI